MILIALACLYTPYALSSAAHAVVLQYHHIDVSTPAITSTAKDDFLQHLNYLVDEGFTVLSLEKVMEQFQTIPNASVAITFDDAYDSVYDTAFPLLRERRMPFSVFVATDLVGRPGYLSWPQLIDLQSNGALILNHTRSHRHLLRRRPGEDEAAWLTRVEGEIVAAQKIIDDRIGKSPRYLAYPYGEFDHSIQKLVTELGFIAFGQHSGAIGYLSDKSALPRYPLSGAYADFDSFKTKVSSLPFPAAIPILEPVLPAHVVRPTLFLALHEPGLRTAELACYASGQGRITIVETILGNFEATAVKDLPIGRSRYNCTMPTTDGRYFWYSQLWIRKNADGSWYQEQ